MVSNLAIILILLLLVAIIIALTLIERRIKEKITTKNDPRNIYYLRKLSRIEKINKQSPSLAIKQLSQLAKAFFKEAYKINSSLGFSDLSEEFKKQGNYQSKDFCDLMEVLLYSPSNNEKALNKAVSILEDVVTKTDLEQSKQNN
ncbi:MAG: hypothetical protein ACP5OG_02450 [Candidatus Nanoarchaeia archaeon]